MKNKLAIVDPRKLSPQRVTELDQKTDALIARHAANRQEISALVEESLTALTAGNKLSRDMATQSVLEKFFGRLNGNNTRTQDAIAAHLTEAQYAAQQILQKLDNQNLLTLELVGIVNDKLNAQMTEVNDELNNVCVIMQAFFQRAAQRLKDMDSEIDTHNAQLESHDAQIERLQHTVTLQNWVIGITTRNFDGTAYKKLDDAAKIVCLVRDFIDLTKDFRLPNDAGNLNAAANNLALADKQINVKNFFDRVCRDDRLYTRLFGEDSRLDDFATDGTLVFALRQFKNSDDKKSFDFGKFARRQKAGDLIATLLDDLDELARAEDLDDKARRAEILFLAGRFGDALPLLEETARAGKIRARYILAIVYGNGLEVEKNPDAAKNLLAANVRAGDVCSIFFGKRLKLDIATDLPIDALKKLADSGDVFAQYQLALHYFAADNETALMYLNQSARIYGVAMFKLGTIYWDGGYGVKQDHDVAVDWYKQACAKGISSDKSLNRIGNYYSGAKNYTEAVSWWRIGQSAGFIGCIASLGQAYSLGLGVRKNYAKAVKYLEQALSKSFGGGTEYDIAQMYLEGGHGIEADRSTAINWFKCVANNGNKDAMRWLLDNTNLGFFEKLEYQVKLL